MCGAVKVEGWMCGAVKVEGWKYCAFAGFVKIITTKQLSKLCYTKILCVCACVDCVSILIGP